MLPSQSCFDHALRARGKHFLVFARRRQLLQNHGLKSHSLHPSGDKLMREEDKSPRAVGCLPIKLQREFSLTSIADGLVALSKRVDHATVQEIHAPITRSIPRLIHD